MVFQNQDMNKGHRQRLRERFISDLGENMPDYEVIELLLMTSIARKDVKPIAKALLTEFGTVSGIFGADIDAIMAVDGVGQSTAVMFKLVQRATSIVLKQEIMNTNILNNWDKLIEYCMVYMAHSTVEQFRVIFLTSRNRIIADEEQSRGTINETSIYPREVIKRALSLNATAVILVHNHPSGNPSPSQEDIHMTHEVMEAGATLNIKVHDHIIIGKEDIVSFKTAGLI